MSVACCSVQSSIEFYYKFQISSMDMVEPKCYTFAEHCQRPGGFYDIGNDVSHIIEKEPPGRQAAKKKKGSESYEKKNVIPVIGTGRSFYALRF